MRPRILNMLDVSHCPGVLKVLDEVAEVISMPPDQETLRTCIGDYDGYLASLAVQIDRSVLERASRLRVIATPSTGTDHIDTAVARERGIAILSLKDDAEFLNQITATAELAWTLLLAVVRRLPGAIEAARRGDWARDRFRGHQLSGKTLGIIGYGRLGRMVAEFGKAFRMQVLACDVRNVTPEPGVKMTLFDEVIRESDVISVHVHLTEENRSLIGSREFAAMKPGAILINTSRGSIIDEHALLSALTTGHLGGAGLDVIEGEWRLDLDRHPLILYARTHENLVITPHIGGVTYESQELAYSYTFLKLAEYLKAYCDRESTKGV